MLYEVEQKYRVEDLERVEKSLKELGSRFKESIQQRDQYFLHPARDFRQTDEALRIRHVNSGSFITYKGPRIDRVTKTRKELELPLGKTEDSARRFEKLLEALGFERNGCVSKRRRVVEIDWQNRACTVVFDEVDQLGTYVEIESTASEEEIDDTRSCLTSLAEQLGLANPETRSYLELLRESGS